MNSSVLMYFSTSQAASGFLHWLEMQKLRPAEFIVFTPSTVPS